MSRVSNKKDQGFALLVPVLAVLSVGIFVVLLQAKVQNQATTSKVVTRRVLSDSDNEAEAQETTEPSKDNSESEVSEPEDTPEPQETPEPSDTENESEIEVNDDTGQTKIKIRNGDNKFEFQQEGSEVQVESDFPVSVDATTSALTISTPAGTKVVAKLPQQAVDGIIASGVLTRTRAVKVNTEEDGNLTYHIDGTKNERFLGFLNVDIPKNLVVSTETGQVLAVNQSVFSKILDLLSF